MAACRGGAGRQFGLWPNTINTARDVCRAKPVCSFANACFAAARCRWVGACLLHHAACARLVFGYAPFFTSFPIRTIIVPLCGTKIRKVARGNADDAEAAKKLLTCAVDGVIVIGTNVG